MDNRERYSILIVDDDPIIIRILHVLLGQFAPLRFALSGKKALEISSKTPPDLVLLDVGMPGLNGFETCAKFKANPALSGIPIIFLTAHDDAEHRKAGLKVGAADFIVKPPQGPLVVARVRAQMTGNRE